MCWLIWLSGIWKKKRLIRLIAELRSTGTYVKKIDWTPENVDFAVEVAKKMNLFEDENDLQETIEFWREYKRVQ